MPSRSQLGLAWSRVRLLPIQGVPPLRVVWGGCWLCLAAARTHPMDTGQPARSPAAAMAFTPSPLLVRQPSAATAGHGWGRGGGGRGGGGAAGMAQADLAAGGQGAAGLAGLLGKQPTAVRRRQEPLVDLALVEGA